jgi:predicted nucleic acid-binding Zn ribbon protein
MSDIQKNIPIRKCMSCGVLMLKDASCCSMSCSENFYNYLYLLRTRQEQDGKNDLK